jgi:N-acetylglucosamine-6-phosphate deacetylase
MKGYRGKLITPEEQFEEGLLVIDQGKIVYAGEADNGPILEKGAVIPVEGWIVPGLIDIHIHGMNGCDVMDGDLHSLKVISESLARCGVTAFLATTMTAEKERLKQVVTKVAEFMERPTKGAVCLGIHLEGPWIHPMYKGAQNESYITAPSVSDLEEIWGAADRKIRVVTIAPDIPGSEEAIRRLKELGMTVSIGHTGAKFDQATRALELGATHFTHCFHAMRGFHHREPGTVGAAMYHESATTELILDGIHSHPTAGQLLYRLKGRERLALVSDAMRATGIGDGTYELGGQVVHVGNGAARLEDGTLAGSILTLNRAVRNAVEWWKVPLREAVHMASLTPASIIGLDGRKGKLKEGYDADFLVLNENGEVFLTAIQGEIVYQAG